MSLILIVEFEMYERSCYVIFSMGSVLNSSLLLGPIDGNSAYKLKHIFKGDSQVLGFQSYLEVL